MQAVQVNRIRTLWGSKSMAKSSRIAFLMRLTVIFSRSATLRIA